MTSHADHNNVVATDGLPLSFRIAPIRGFLEVGLKDNETMTAIEIQVADAGFGPAIIVLLHRPDGSIDVVASDQQLDEDWFHQDPCMSHLPLGRIGVASFQRANCRIDDRSVDIDVSLDADHLSGRLEIAAQHRFTGPGRPSFVPAVPGSGERQTLRLILAGAIRSLPKSADPIITLDGNRLELAPLQRFGPIVLARQARLGSDVFGVGLNLTGTVGVPRPAEPTSESGEQQPLDLAVGRGRHRFTLRLLTTAGEPVRATDLVGSGATTGAQGKLVIDSSLGPVATGDWQLDADRSGSSMTLSGVTQQWSPGPTNPAGVLRDLARRRRRSGERWHWSAKWQAIDQHVASHVGQWTVRETG